jgi:hypothetical protein
MFISYPGSFSVYLPEELVCLRISYTGSFSVYLPEELVCLSATRGVFLFI